jgi:hypothetical protein
MKEACERGACGEDECVAARQKNEEEGEGVEGGVEVEVACWGGMD